jgi:hypothetical protein
MEVRILPWQHAAGFVEVLPAGGTLVASHGQGAPERDARHRPQRIGLLTLGDCRIPLSCPCASGWKRGEMACAT